MCHTESMRPLLSLLTSICLTATLSHAPLVAREVHGCCTPLEQIQTHLELLTLYLQQQKLEAARKELFNAQLLLDLHYPQLLNQYAFWKQVAAAHARLGNTDTAYGLYLRLFQSLEGAASERFEWVERAGLLLNLGQLALQQDQKQRAQFWLRQTLQTYQARDVIPPPVLAYHLWAADQKDLAYDVLMQVQKTGETGVASLNRIWPEDPVVLQSWYLAFADLLLSQGQAESARVWLDQASVLTPEISTSPNVSLWASLLLRLKEPGAAAELYAQMLAREPENPDYALALAESRLQQGRVDLAAEAYRQAHMNYRGNKVRQASKATDAAWRALLFGLKSTGQMPLAEDAFQRIHSPTAEDLLQGAYLAVERGDDSLARQRFQQVLAQLDLEAAASGQQSPEAKVVEWSAMFALEQRRLKASQTPDVYRQREADLTQKLAALVSVLEATPAGRTLLLNSAMGLGTDASLDIAERVLQEPPPPGEALTWLSHAADLALRRQARLQAALLYEQLYEQWYGQLSSQALDDRLPRAQWAGIARGLSAVGKTQAADVLWQEILKKPSPQQLQFQWESLQNQVRQAQQKHDTKRLKRLRQDVADQSLSEEIPVPARLAHGQLALMLDDFEASEASFQAVLKAEPGTLLARQGLALSWEAQGRRPQAHKALTDLADWLAPTDPVARDARLRLARIEVDWKKQALAARRLARLSRGHDGVAWQAREAQQDLFSTYFPLFEKGDYHGFFGGRQQDLFIGDQYRRYGVLETEHRVQWVSPHENAHRPPLIHEFSVFAERYQVLEGANGFAFQRGGLKWQQYWRHEFEQGPLFAWVTPALAYRWGLPEPLSIGINQHGHGQLQLGLQLTPQQRVRWDSDLKFGQAELYLGSFHNYGTTLRWQWRDGLALAEGLWGVDLLTGIDNYLVLDGNGEPQGLFRQRNGIEMVYQDAQRNIDYTGRFELNPIFGSLSDTHMNTAHAFTQGLDPDWDLTYSLEAHHYGLPLQRYQNYWRAQMGVAYHLPTPLAQPLSLHIGVGLIHFYQTDQPPAPQFFVNVLSQR